jgi:hypothetical protein
VGDIMKKKIIAFILLCTISILLVVYYRGYGRTKAYAYAKHFAEVSDRRTSFVRQLVITDDVQVEKIIKQTPLNLVYLIKWGDGEKAYINIDNWMTRAHDFIEVHPVDKNKIMVIYE